EPVDVGLSRCVAPSTCLLYRYSFQAESRSSYRCALSSFSDVGLLEAFASIRDFQKIKCSTKIWYTVPQNGLGGSMLELTEEIKSLLLNTAKELKGRALRMFMARTVQALGEG